MIEAAERVRRYANGETQLRLNADNGIRRFRKLAAALNKIADGIDDRELQFAAVAEATGDVIWEWRTTPIPSYGRASSGNCSACRVINSRPAPPGGMPAFTRTTVGASSNGSIA